MPAPTAPNLEITARHLQRPRHFAEAGLDGIGCGLALGWYPERGDATEADNIGIP
jgi:hypothetical protein